MAEWVVWGLVENIVRDNLYNRNDAFQHLKKAILKAQPAEIAENVHRAKLGWTFLVNWVAVGDKLNIWRPVVIQVFHKLSKYHQSLESTVGPTWISVWKEQPELHEKMRLFPDDLQAALGAQDEVLKASISAHALKAEVSLEDSPEMIHQAIQQEVSSDALKDAKDSLTALRHSMAGAPYGPAASQDAGPVWACSRKTQDVETMFQTIYKLEASLNGSDAVVDEGEDRLDARWTKVRLPEGHILYVNFTGSDYPLTTWVRPPELGGPHVYKVGEQIEVWSNTLHEWAQGIVLEADTVMIVGTENVGKQRVNAFTDDGQLLASAAPAEDHAGFWRLGIEPGVDSVLITSVFLAVMLLQ